MSGGSGKFIYIVMNVLLAIGALITAGWLMIIDPLTSIALLILGIDGLEDSYRLYTNTPVAGWYRIPNIIIESMTLVFSLYIVFISLKMVAYYNIFAWIIILILSIGGAYTSYKEIFQSSPTPSSSNIIYDSEWTEPAE